MKTLILLILFPLACFSQEVPVGFINGGVWDFPKITFEQAALAFDSLGVSDSVQLDSMAYQNDSVVTLWGNLVGEVFADRMIVKVVDDTIYTAPETATIKCSTICTGYDCVGLCTKTASCACSCDGQCLEKNLAYPLIEERSIGELLRNRIIISVGNKIPD